MSHTLAVYDMDFVVFQAAALAEERTITVVHKQSGREKSFKTRTDFYGHWKKKQGGWLAEVNKTRETPFLVDEFDIIDVQTPSSFGHCVNVINTQIEAIQSKLNFGADSYYGFVGNGNSFREKVSTIIKYKSNRDNMLRPIHLSEAKQYVVDKCNCEFQEDIEVDDRVVMECYKNPERILVAVDKDSMGTGCLVFNPDKMDTPLDCNCFGKLYLNDKNEVKGYGRKWFYYQIAYGDDSDNYFANSANPEYRWGEKSAYNALAGAKTDKEALQALVDVYKTLYPEPKVITGWRGNEITVDWKYMLQENTTLAHMLRFEGDKILVDDVLNRLGISV